MSDADGIWNQPTAKESEGIYRAIFEQAAVGVAQIVSRTGAFVRINRRFAEILGYSVAEMEHLTFQEITHPDDLQEDLDNMRRLLAGEIREFSMEKRYHHKDGSIVWGNLTVSPMWATGEEPNCHIAVVEDITIRKQAEQALRESESRLRETQQMARLGNWYWDVRTGEVEWSDEVYRIFRLDPKKFTPQIDSILELSPWPGDRERNEELIRKAMVSRDQGSYEQRFLRPDGSVGYYFSTFQGIYDDDGTVTAMKGTVQDVTEHRRAQHDYQTLFKQMLNGFALHEVVCDEQGHPIDFRFLAVNPAFERLTGLAAEDVVGKTMLEIMPNTERNFIERFGRVALSGEPLSFVNHFPQLDKHYNVSAFRPAPGQFASIFDDITDRKRAEDALRASEEQLQTVVQTMPIMVDAFDDAQNIIVWNRECERVTGYTAEEVVGNSLAMNMLYPDAEYRDWVMASIRREEGDFRNMEFTLTSKNGEPRTVLWSNLSASHPINGWAAWAVGLDITEHKRAEREREELIAQLESQNAELERFTYTVSHDLKSPLITIKGYIGLLSEDLHEMSVESVRRDLGRISNAADRMSVLLEDLLELSRIGRLVNPPEDVSLNELAHDALTLLRGRLEDSQVEVEVQPDLPVVSGDRTRLLEVVQNLVDNAVKYLGSQPHPRIEIGTRRGDDEIVCYVRDNGIGIEPPYHDKVFGLFDQLDPSTEGTGVGLALVKRIVEVHGGRIWIESEGMGRGSTFCFTLSETTS